MGRKSLGGGISSHHQFSRGGNNAWVAPSIRKNYITEWKTLGLHFLAKKEQASRNEEEEESAITSFGLNFFFPLPKIVQSFHEWLARTKTRRTVQWTFFLFLGPPAKKKFSFFISPTHLLLLYYYYLLRRRPLSLDSI